MKKVVSTDNKIQTSSILIICKKETKMSQNITKRSENDHSEEILIRYLAKPQLHLWPIAQKHK